MSLRHLFRPKARPSRPSQVRPQVEALEARWTPYSVSGNAWPHPELITLSFVPDGTVLGAGTQGIITSNLFARLNSHPGWTTDTWGCASLTSAATGSPPPCSR